MNKTELIAKWNDATKETSYYYTDGSTTNPDWSQQQYPYMQPAPRPWPDPFSWKQESPTLTVKHGYVMIKEDLLHKLLDMMLKMAEDS